MPNDYLLFSDAVTQLETGMYSGLPPPNPVEAIRKTYLKASVGFGPRRQQAGRHLTRAVLNGELAVYVASNIETSDAAPTIVPVNVLQRLITVRDGLPDRPIRSSRRIVDGNAKLSALLDAETGVLVVKESEFGVWYRSDRGKRKWPSQRRSLKAGRGRPTRQTDSIRNAVLHLIDCDKWRRADGIPALRRLLQP